jgi:hypothetical protein
MATYYVKLAADGGNDSLAGTSPSSAWATIGKALGATGISSGDTVYIAPGTYNESVTIGITNPTAETFIIGDPTASQFPGIAAGPVYHSAWNAAGTTQITSGVLITGTTKNYLHFQNIWWSSDAANMVVLNTSRYAKFTRCQFVSSNQAYTAIRITSATSNPVDATITRCCFVGMSTAIFIQGTNTTDATSVTDCLFLMSSLIIDSNNTNFAMFNCTFFSSVNGVVQRANTTGTASFVRNSLFLCYSNFAIQSTTGAGPLTENFNRFLGSGRQNVTAGANSVSTGAQGVDYTYLLNQGMNYQQMWTSLQGGPNIAFGTATGAPAADLYGVTWTGASPDAGSGAYRVINSTPSQIAYNGGNERNASTITIAPGSTSQSIELYLGATGLTASTSGLTARYNRTRTASVSIPLVARTIAQPWIAGGFAEVDAVTMPGIYRLDLPNEAVAIGADDVTVNVRGAAGTNGAVITINLKAIESSLIAMGPYKVIADGLGSDQPLDIMQGVQAPVSVQVVDVNENGIDITGATVQAKAYNSAGTLVGTYTCTPTYAADGRCTFLLTTDVTNVAGVYSVTITRAVGGNVVVFGPLKVMVRAN